MNKYSKNYTVILYCMKYFNYRLIPIVLIKYIQNAFVRYATTKKLLLTIYLQTSNIG